MYALKPIIDSTSRLDGDLTTMYRLKCVYDDFNTNHGAPTNDRSAVSPAPLAAKRVNRDAASITPTTITNQIDKLIKNISSNEMTSLEQRQDRVLAQLNELKLQLESMQKASVINKKEVKKVAKPAVPKEAPTPRCGKPPSGYIKQQMLHSKRNGAPKPIQKANLGDVVINANPNAIPYSLRAIKTLWQNRLHIAVTTFTHSSVAATEASRKFSESMQWSHVVDTANQIPVLRVTLIWKDVAQPELISLAANYIPIIGEVNIVRFLYRIGPNEFYDQTPTLEVSLATDAILDAVAILPATKDKKLRAFTWKQLGIAVGKNEFFGTECICIADVAVSSEVKRCSPTENLPPILLHNLKVVNATVGYELTPDFY